MLLSISTTHQPASDLGYLLGKNPARAQAKDFNFGRAHVFYPESGASRCTACLLLDLDPVDLVRGREGGQGEGAIGHYVNDRPYVASSLFAVAIAQVFRSALNGHCSERPELASLAIPLEAEIPVLRCQAGEARLHACFAPLGYAVSTTPLPLDKQFPEWGDSPYYALMLRGNVTLANLLAHLYVLLPALDGEKHYYVGDAEVQKLLAKGGDWLQKHPERDWILKNYLKRQRSLVRDALAQLQQESPIEAGVSEEQNNEGEEAIERRVGLNEQRMQRIEAKAIELDVASVLDVGCGDGKLLKRLLSNYKIKKILGVDVSFTSLERAADRIGLDRLPPKQRERIQLEQGSLTYRDARLSGFDLACAIEVIEHIDPDRHDAFARVLFESAHPKSVLISTPNVEYNVLFEGLAAKQLRHRDHRFEWTRAQFEDWAHFVARRYGYQVCFEGIGDTDAQLGAPTQLAVFQR